MSLKETENIIFRPEFVGDLFRDATLCWIENLDIIVPWKRSSQIRYIYSGNKKDN